MGAVTYFFTNGASAPAKAIPMNGLISI
jgi:hypothetical protein